MSSLITVDVDRAPQEALAPRADDWDRHWRDFSAASELSPATHYRRRLALRLFRNDGHDACMRMLEIGSGMGQFAEQFLEQAPQAQFLGLELSRSGVEMASRRVPAARFIQRDLLAPGPAGCSPPDGLDFRATHALCSDVLEHLDDPCLLLRHAAPGASTSPRGFSKGDNRCGRVKGRFEA